MINFILPGFYNHRKLLEEIIIYKEKYPQQFMDDVTIGACYDNFQICVWDGGRSFVSYKQASKEDIIEIRDFYQQKKIPLRLIFTNPVITEKDLHNNFCNLIASLCEDENNEIVINSPILEEYIRKTYPKYKIISSTTKCLTNTQEVNNELNKDYYMTCLDYNLNHNQTFLESIPKELRPKVEFLINAICPAGCPNRKEHYRLNGFFHLNFCKNYHITCGIKEGTLDFDSIQKRNNITPDEIYNQYVKKGFSNFKIEGRTLSNLELLLNIAKYMVKPNYQLQFILSIYQKLYPEQE